jgi:4-diphosphocytidyl-2-C-methyl-D-erythritol kinase
LKVTAPAKINLNLNIIGQRNDGYHLLDSVMGFTEWGDKITITPDNEFTLTAVGPYSNIFTGALLSTDRGAPNLIVQAVHLMADKAGKNPNINVRVAKYIPAGAGLGGGSSDAATVMLALNKMWGMNLPPEELRIMGLELGAELPVCLHRRPARVTGIGEELADITVPALHLVITWPEQGLLTKLVFDEFDKAPKFSNDLNDQTIPEDERRFVEWMKNVGNDLTDAATILCPDIKKILSNLWECDGCLLSRMTGSGGACYGVFESKQAAKAASERFPNSILTAIRSQA